MPEDPWEGENRPGYKYERACKSVYSYIGPTPKVREAKKIAAKKKFDEDENRYLAKTDNFLDIQTQFSSDDRKYKEAEKEFNKVKKEFEKKERLYRQDKFRKAVYFLGLDIELGEVLTFSGLMTGISFFAMIMIVLLLSTLGVDVIASIALIAPAVLLIPIGIFTFVSSYPELLAERVRVQSLGRSPEVISYMTMSMQLSPSLSKAIEFAAENTEEPLGSRLKRVSWDVFMRKSSSIEESFLSFAYEWGEWNEDFKRALYAIRSSTLEQTNEGLRRSLDRASEIIRTGTKKKIEEFATSLSGPTTILFSMCVLLPMIVGAMLPMMSLDLTMDFNNVETTAQDIPAQVSDEMKIGLIVLMDVLFPFIAFAYSWNIIGKRPGTSTPPTVINPLSKQRIQFYLFISLTIMVALATLGSLILTGQIYDDETMIMIGSIPILLGIGLGSGLFLWVTSKEQKKQRDNVIKMENEFPDALFQLGSRIAEGNPLEVALTKTTDSMPDTLIGDLFGKVSFQMRTTRTSLEDVLFGKFGVLNDIPSRTINASMKTIVEIVKKDAITAGQNIISMSEFIKDMKKVEHDIKMELGSTVEMMKSTGVLFSPLVMGITSSLYVLLYNEFSNMPNPPAMVPPSLFFAIIGIYLMLAVVIAIYFSVGIEFGGDRVALKYNLGISLAVATCVYAVATVLGSVFFVG